MQREREQTDGRVPVCCTCLLLVSVTAVNVLLNREVFASALSREIRCVLPFAGESPHEAATRPRPRRGSYEDAYASRGPRAVTQSRMYTAKLRTQLLG